MIGVAKPERNKPKGIAGRDFVSWSQLSTFRQCPLRYQFRYLDKVEPKFVASSLLVGSAIHSAVEHFHRKQLESDETLTTEALLEVFWDEWRDRTEESAKVRFSKNEDINSIHDLAERMLSAFLASDLSRLAGTIIGIEETLRSEVVTGRPEFLGVIDLVYETDNRLIIRDLKTSRSRWHQGTAESSAGQLSLYAELARDLLPTAEVSLEFAVITKAKTPVVELFEVAADRRRLERVKLVAGKTLDAIESGHFFPNASPMNCGGCAYRSACSAWRG